MRELHRRGDPELREAGDVLVREQLRVLDPVPEPERAPDVLRRLERVQRLAVREVADRVHRDGEAGACAAAHDLLQLLARGDLHARAVEETSGLRAERPVHERLQVADAQELVAEARPHVHRLELADLLVRERLPDAKRQRLALAKRLPEAQRAEPAVLVVHGDDAAAVRELHPDAHRLDVLVVGDLDVAVAERPARLLAQHACRLAALVTLDDAARHLEVPVRAGERGRVEPERVRVARHQRDRDVARQLVQLALRRLDVRRPVAASPAAASQPCARPYPCERVAHTRDRFVERLRVLETQLLLRNGPRGEVDVRIREAGEHAAPAEVDDLGRGERRLVRPDPAGDPAPGDGERPRDRQRGIEGANDAVLEDHGADSRLGAS